jgi:hypothetical protein
MNDELREFLEHIAEKQKETAAAIDEIRARENITLDDLYAIQKQQSEAVCDIALLIADVKADE